MPVFNRPQSNPIDFSDSASSADGGSSTRPAGLVSEPMCVSPFRNVPVVTISARHPIRIAVLHRETGEPAVLDENLPGPANQPLDIRFRVEHTP